MSNPNCWLCENLYKDPRYVPAGVKLCKGCRQMVNDFQRGEATPERNPPA